jgi:hypothetical protein
MNWVNVTVQEVRVDTAATRRPPGSSRPASAAMPKRERREAAERADVLMFAVWLDAFRQLTSQDCRGKCAGDRLGRNPGSGGT